MTAQNKPGVPSRLTQRAQGKLPHPGQIGVGSGLYNPPEPPRTTTQQASSAEHTELMEGILLYPEALLIRVVGGRDRAESERRVQGAAPDQLRKWLSDLESAENDMVDAEVEESAESALRSQLRIQPDDPNYNPAQDTARRLALEDVLDPLDFSSMLFNDFVEQRIPIRSDFSVIFRTISAEHSLWLMDLASEGSGKSLRWFQVMQVSVALQALIGPDGKQVAIGRDLSTASDRDSFQRILNERYERVKRFPDVLVDDLLVQHWWFQGRVRKLLVGNLAKKVGN